MDFFRYQLAIAVIIILSKHRDSIQKVEKTTTHHRSQRRTARPKKDKEIELPRHCLINITAPIHFDLLYTVA